MIFRTHLQADKKRAGLVSALALAMMVTVAACGGPTDPGVQPVATATQTVELAPVETGVGAPVETAQATAPAALPTESSDMTDGADMGDMAEGATTPTQAATNPGGAATATPAADQGASEGATAEVQATLREWALDLDRQEVPAGKVVFNVTNAGQFAHNLTVEDSTGVIGKTPNFSSRDGAQVLELELAPGTYNVICSLPGHAARGQQNQLVVK